MAFNPNGYQTMYGFSTLDELHNFFPELLYDDQLFPHETLLWARHRIRTLFPNVFVRQQNLYTIYQARDRRAQHSSWHNTIQSPPRVLRSPIAHPRPISVPTPPVAQQPVVETTPMRQTTTQPPTTPPPRAQRRSRPIDSLEFLFQTGPLMETLLLGTNINLNTMLPYGDDVPVVPTSAEIATGSTELPYSEIPADANCAVCQEHGEVEVWRKIHCGHIFHNRCISTWFRRDVHCPVCRADVRDGEAAPADS